MEEWEYLKGNKTLYREVIKENHRQIHPLDCGYEDNSDTKPNLETNLCCENKPSEIGMRNQKKISQMVTFLQLIRKL
ncbi:hypothetical protein GDO86_019932 [Hymenochirus boettgeri]|uniref:KRAB domain-containing protein n=1 Tax=Hymenochirus boettgeri TaxID=247094 RepID=A0A8T2IL06_9PIPI|nr:hypothetical protein GDO86_019932 [Hymenochirus boettgeri]